ncbi:unnamed protein product [Didymodactylos carnosus]|uniref:peptidyl-tRNA hydrolase n=1 Tax=Didymodactylos carnosus TaxID=1234261 RepID=A0A814MAF5_9BILA|nr:unnamed protein product [Didymodactylos carnosus]CAF1075604.1 unnamed protein product [Didymodactylos carnosus]CAF3627283.1 unnamed protein product [Didymodactylos carnosus]CAF3842182.1 unnamed protein product [Didymodactylos carnosus]
MSTNDSKSASSLIDTSPIVQYILLRGDLKKSKSYNDGALIAQACHACSAILFKTLDDVYTVNYLNDTANMHKIILNVPTEDELIQAHKTLTEGDIQHYLWLEKPENIKTCIAVKPYVKSDVENYFKQYKLYR